jgi:hypothetical protein
MELQPFAIRATEHRSVSEKLITHRASLLEPAKTTIEAS